MTSAHYDYDREYREKFILTIGQGKKVAEFIVDRGHKNGAERHVITDTAIILIYNVRTNKLITKLIARPNQIKRYFPNGDFPQRLVDLAYQHVKQGFNI